eukprot:1037430-Prymnesium_polylepis.1
MFTVQLYGARPREYKTTGARPAARPPGTATRRAPARTALVKTFTAQPRIQATTARRGARPRGYSCTPPGEGRGAIPSYPPTPPGEGRGTE